MQQQNPCFFMDIRTSRDEWVPLLNWFDSLWRLQDHSVMLNRCSYPSTQNGGTGEIVLSPNVYMIQSLQNYLLVKNILMGTKDKT